MRALVSTSLFAIAVAGCGDNGNKHVDIVEATLDFARRTAARPPCPTC